MTDRETLIELMRQVDACICNLCDGGEEPFNHSAEILADHLIANGVVVREKGEWDIKHRHHGGFRRYTGYDDFGEKHTITVDERSECDEPYCPKCGKWNESVWRNFCPNCGADMRKEN